MKLLVTGGAGFIGSNFVHHILSKYPEYEVVVLDKLTYAGNKDNLKDIMDNPKLAFVKGDICDKKLDERLMRDCDTAVNFAAETHVDRSIIDAGSFVTTDVVGTYRLLEAARKADLKKFVQISTDEVYGEAGQSTSTEDSPLNPKSPYAASKAGADRLAYSYFATYGLPVVISRCTNNYGPCQYPEKLIPLFITNALRDIPLPIYGTGKNTRDWIYVDDHCRGIDLLMHGKYDGEVFNFGSGRELSVLEITRIILEALGKPQSLVSFVNDRPGHVTRHAVNAEKSRRLLGWSASADFESHILKTIGWYRNNRWWWEPLVKRDSDRL